MDVFIDKENSGTLVTTSKRKRKGLSVRKRALQTLEETNTSTCDEHSINMKQQEKTIKSTKDGSENSDINVRHLQQNNLHHETFRKNQPKNISTPITSGNGTKTNSAVAKFKMPDYIKNFGKGPSRMKKNNSAFGTPRDKASMHSNNNNVSNSKSTLLASSSEKGKLVTRLGGAKRITSGNSSTSNNNNNDKKNNSNTNNDQPTFENTTSSIPTGLYGTITKLEAIQEVINSKTLNSLNGSTVHTSSLNDSTATNVTNASIVKSEKKQALAFKKTNTPSVNTKFSTSNIKNSSSKKATTQVNIKLDYIKNWKPTRSKPATPNVENIQSATKNQHIKPTYSNTNNDNVDNVINSNVKQHYHNKNTIENSNCSDKILKANVRSDNKKTNISSKKINNTKSSSSSSSNSKMVKMDEHKNREVKQDPSKSSKISNRKQSMEMSFNTLMTSKNIVTVSGRSYMRLEQIGRGGSSKVYKVLGSDMKVYALKRIRPQRMNRKTLSIFQNEINLMVKLKGKPNIIQLIDAEINMEKKCIYMVMEMGDIDLNHLLKKRKEEAAKSSVASNENFLRITWQQMLEAVHTIHQNRIVHSDLKPANFLCVKGVLKLIDFGIAKAINDDTVNIHRESQIGTINYMSPESITDTGSHSGATPFGKRKQHMKLGRSSDIWSLGCILYQMVYGKTPFAHLGLVQKLQAITNSKYEINYPDYPNPALINTIKSCLQRDRKLRPTIDGPNGLLTNEFLNPKSNNINKTSSPITELEKKIPADTSNQIDSENMSELVDGLLDLGHRLGATKNERDKKVREKLALELYDQFQKGKPFDLEDALDSAVSKR
jgi:serine/threonine-protein kinase TTK/MPS1